MEELKKGLDLLVVLGGMNMDKEASISHLFFNSWRKWGETHPKIGFLAQFRKYYDLIIFLDGYAPPSSEMELY